MPRMPADLFATEPPPDEPRVYSVTEVTRSVRAVLEDRIGTVWIEGEVSNYRKQPSGHQYFTLKDASCQLACVWFARGQTSWRKQTPLSDGMQVQVRGSLTVYEARGQYQLTVQLVQAAGAGLLQAKFEALKRKLEAEGLFDSERKRALPKFPTAIGIVTSSTGAALRDMLNILGRRAPWMRVVVSPVRVQGEGAAEEIAAAIGELNRFAEFGLKPVDVIVVGRGGGSAEDLWEFNEEIVARAIAASEIPVVSAVGHEIDFTIADFAADLRAPTPSAAAELVAPDTGELLRRLAQLTAQARRRVLVEIEQQRSQLDYFKRSALFREPQQRLAEAAQQCDSAGESLQRVMRARLDEMRQRLGGLASSLRQHRPDQLLALVRQEIASLRARLGERMSRLLGERRQRFDKAAALLRLLSPEATLARGYSITTTEAGARMSSIQDAGLGATIVTRLADGALHSTVTTAVSRDPRAAVKTPKRRRAAKPPPPADG